MTYSFILPILIILSIIGVIIFLIKKAPEVAMINESEQEKGDIRERKGWWKRESIGETTSKPNRFSWLGNLGSFLGGMLTKFGDKLVLWTSRIRKVREKRVTLEKKEVAAEKGNLEMKLNQYERRNASGTKERLIKIEENESRPMISEKIVPSRSKVGQKDRLEKILIERIAVNPKDIEAYERLGEYYLEINNLDYAKECFKQVIKLDSSNIAAKARMRRLERILGK